MNLNQHYSFLDKSEIAEVQLAMILAQVTHHIHPSIVARIVEANIEFKNEFKSFCNDEALLNDFFYAGSDCVFPGLRRPINNEKAKGWKNKQTTSDNTILNDNTYPRHIWTYLCGGQKYSGGTNGTWRRFGLSAFELAHIFAHKHGERDFEFTLFKTHNRGAKPYSLFTSASNVVLIPKWLPKPTDKSNSLKKAFYQRHSELYGEITALPGLTNFDVSSLPTWYSSITWSDPELPKDWKSNIDRLITFRNTHLRNKYS